jgi:hypothetical protein
MEQAKLEAEDAVVVAENRLLKLVEAVKKDQTDRANASDDQKVRSSARFWDCAPPAPLNVVLMSRMCKLLADEFVSHVLLAANPASVHWQTKELAAALNGQREAEARCSQMAEKVEGLLNLIRSEREEVRANCRCARS